MRKKAFGIITLIGILIICSLAAVAAEKVTLNVKESDIRDVLQMMGEQSNMNIVPDSSVQGEVTLVLNQVTVEEALQTLLQVYQYHYEKVNDNTYIISQNTLTEPYLLEIKAGKMTLIAQSIDMKRILTDIGDQAKANLIFDQSINAQVNANLIEVDFYHGLKSLCSANSLTLMEREGIYTIKGAIAAQQGRQMAVSYSDGLISVDVRNGDLAELIRTIAEQSGINVVLYGGNHQLVDLKIQDVPVEAALEMVVSGTRYAFKKVDNVYLIGDKSINSPSSSLLTTNEVIPLKYLQAEKVPAMLPNTFPATNIKVIKELNALAVVGTREEINELKNYLNKIDNKIPQIVVEAIILDVSRNSNHDPLMKLGIRAAESEGGSVLLDTVMGKLSYNSVLRLKPDFYLDLQNLASDGVVTIKARPKITTLNGFQAKINVGSVQYYKTSTSDDNGSSQTQYQTINAGITLDVIPWVSSTGEITLELHPNVSNLGGTSADAPPMVSQRQIDTTVRVKSGETIVLGGLIQNVENETISKVPVLGDLPWVGQLFQRTTSNVSESELIIFITPHILDEERETISQQDLDNTIQDMETRYDETLKK